MDWPCLLNVILHRADKVFNQLPQFFVFGHKQLLNVNRPSINVMKAHSIQINCPSAGVGLSSSSFI
jgi:hypothetical protein